MADAKVTSANVVISSPAQQFTRTDQFQALFYGKIYIGQIDKDPRNPANQIDVFIEQEDGSLFKVPQPLRTNAAGFPVYNGKIVKFVTTSGHSMALYDQTDVLQNYYPNVLKYDPDQFSGSVSGPDGLKVIGRADSVAQLKQIVGVKDQWINVASYTAGTHKGGGFFYWINDTMEIEDGGVFFRVNANGGWKRDLPVDQLTIEHFGAVADGVTDAIPAIQRFHAWAAKYAASLGLSQTYAPGVQLPPGKFGVSSMDLGDSEIGAFKLYGPVSTFGVIPQVTLVPLNKTTTTPAFRFKARRMEVRDIHWDGPGSVQPFMVNTVTRGAYVRVSRFVATDYGGRVFQIKDTIDTKFDQFYSYNGRAGFLWVTWSNENPGAWDHPTAIELSNFNISSSTNEYAISAIRAGQSMMYNGWFDHCEWPFDISQGGWTLDNVTMENAANPAACKWAKLIEVYTRWEQGQGLSFDASGYDPAMDAGKPIPTWVTNNYDQGRIVLNIKGSLFDCGVATRFNWSNTLVDNSTTNADTWYFVGSVILPRLGDVCKMRLVGAANWDNVGGTIDRPGGTNFGTGEATIAIEMKAPQAATTTAVEAHWWGEDNAPISAVKLVHAWQTIGVYVKMRQFCKYAAVFMDTTGRPRQLTGTPMYFRADLSAVPDISTVANAVDVPARKTFNKGDYNSNGFGMDFDTGDFVLFQTNRVTRFGNDFIPMRYNGLVKYLPVRDLTIAQKMSMVSLAELSQLPPNQHVGCQVMVTDARLQPYQRGSSRVAWSEGYQWTWADDLSLVAFN